MKEIKIIITFDIDPDSNNSNRAGRWNGLKKGCLLITKQLKKYFKNDIPISWFVRVDDEIKNEFGSYLGLINKNKKLFKKLESFNGKFYPHPHLYFFDKKKKTWKQELDEKKNLIQIKNILRSLKNSKFFKQKIIRFGGHYFSNKILELLIQKRFQIDSTSLPCRTGTPSKPFDWKNCEKNLHFLKSKKKKGRILEAPPSMFKIKADYDNKPFLRYLDLTFKNKLIKKYIKNVNFNNGYILTLSHPAQVILKKKHGLLGFGVNNYLKNIKQIVQRIEKKGLKYRFYHIEDLLNLQNLNKLKTYEK